MDVILFQKIVLQRLNQVTADEVLKYAKQYGIQVTRKQALEVEKLVKGKTSIFLMKKNAINCSSKWKRSLQKKRCSY